MRKEDRAKDNAQALKFLITDARTFEQLRTNPLFLADWLISMAVQISTEEGKTKEEKMASMRQLLTLCGDLEMAMTMEESVTHGGSGRTH